MERRKFGRIEPLVWPIGLGLAALGRPGYINLGHAEDLGEEYAVAAMEAHTHKVLDAAYGAGIRYFDAARSYGRAEAFLASWLRSRKVAPEDVTVGSKWGYTYTADWQVKAKVHEVKEHSLDVLKRQWRESQEHLARHLDLYQIHSATLESGVLENTAVLAELARLRSDVGVAIGLTVSGPRQAEVIERAVGLTVDGVRLFDSVQATWNLLEISSGPALAAAAAEGMGVLVKEALANGRLTPRNSEPDFAPKLAVLEAEAQRLNATVDGLALAAVLAQPWTTVVLSGAARVDHLQSNLGALDVVWDAGARRQLAGLVESPEEYWQRRSELEWK
jgi:aryl-alcohol dehydrogenase-like predicted oxidoreductase